MIECNDWVTKPEWIFGPVSSFTIKLWEGRDRTAFAMFVKLNRKHQWSDSCPIKRDKRPTILSALIHMQSREEKGRGGNALTDAEGSSPSWLPSTSSTTASSASSSPSSSSSPLSIHMQSRGREEGCVDWRRGNSWQNPPLLALLFANLRALLQLLFKSNYVSTHLILRIAKHNLWKVITEKKHKFLLPDHLNMSKILPSDP